MKSAPGSVPPFNIGGQAVLEGVMMRSPSAVATAVRKSDGRIVITHRPFRGVARRFKLLNLPILRGGVNLVETLVLGMQALSFSAEEASSGEAAQRAAEPGSEGSGLAALARAEVVPLPAAVPAVGEWKAKLGMAGMMLFAFAAGLGLFFYVPLLLTEWTGVKGGIAFNLVDGLFRIVFFLAYLWGISRWKEMRRVFQYHGAEHKSIFVFESGLPLEPEESRRFTTLHPRCGTSFLLLVMLTSIVVFTFLGRPESLGERLLRLAFVPVIGGIAYELIKLSGKQACQRWMKPIILPGLWLQKITTKEPGLDQVEVAMAAVRACLEYEDLQPAQPAKPARVAVVGTR